MNYPVWDFVCASLLMGLGIGADVASATFARAAQLSTLRLALLWVLGVSLTHTVFPMLGYLTTYFSIQLLPTVTPVVGVIAFVCIFVYLKSELMAIRHENNSSDNRQLLVTLGLILAVSWDALWSGPAKSAQVVGWPELLVWLSFIIVGCLVSIMAILSLRWGLRWHVSNQGDESQHKGQGLAITVQWFQYSVIGYFGLLALSEYTFALTVPWWQVMSLSGAVVMLCLLAVSSSPVTQRA